MLGSANLLGWAVLKHPAEFGLRVPVLPLLPCTGGGVAGQALGAHSY